MGIRARMDNKTKVMLHSGRGDFGLLCSRHSRKGLCGWDREQERPARLCRTSWAIYWVYLCDELKRVMRSQDVPMPPSKCVGKPEFFLLQVWWKATGGEFGAGNNVIWLTFLKGSSPTCWRAGWGGRETIRWQHRGSKRMVAWTWVVMSEMWGSQKIGDLFWEQDWQDLLMDEQWRVRGGKLWRKKGQSEPQCHCSCGVLEVPPGKSLLSMPNCRVCHHQEHKRKKRSQNVQYASFLSSEKWTLLSDLMGINSDSKKTTHSAVSYWVPDMVRYCVLCCGQYKNVWFPTSKNI